MRAFSNPRHPANTDLDINRDTKEIVIQLARLGDYLHSTPLLAALKRANPEGSLEVLVTPAQAPLAKATSQVDRVHILDPGALRDAAGSSDNFNLRLARMKGLISHLWELAPDRAFCLNLGAMGGLIMEALNPAQKGAWRFENGSLKGEAWTPFIMNLVRNRRLTRLHLSDILVSYADPPAPPLARLEHRVNDLARREAAALIHPGGPLVILQLGANNDLRRWPIESFVSLAKGLINQGVRLALVGSNAEQHLAARLLSGLGHASDKALNLMGRTGLTGLGAVLESADLVISCDTGTLHLATAVGARVLALFMGPAQAHETGPYGAGHLVIQARDNCGPCQEHNPVCQGRAPCRRLISPELALKAALSLLEGKGGRAAMATWDQPPGLEPLLGAMDNFGQRYELLAQRPVTEEDALALALREAGRCLLRSRYQPDQASLASEIRAQYQSPRPDQAKAINRLAGKAKRFGQAINAGDPRAVRRLLASTPEFASLGSVMGADGANHETLCRAGFALGLGLSLSSTC